MASIRLSTPFSMTGRRFLGHRINRRLRGHRRARLHSMGENVIMAVVPDISGNLRGKGFPESARDERFRQGIGWCPTCVQITSFGDIANTPYGSFGDLHIMPDEKTEVRLDFEDGGPLEWFVLGDVTEVNGQPWTCCLRQYLRDIVKQIHDQTGITIKCAFEHEFYYSGGDRSPGCAYNLRAFRKANTLAHTLMGILKQAGLKPDSFMPEFAPAQYELTIDPSDPLTAADQASILREVVRATAEKQGEKASFAPLMAAGGVGNGLHIHLSLHRTSETGTLIPITHDSSESNKISRTAAQFSAGILRALPSIVAVTAPSVASYQRLVPHRWSAPYNNLGYRDREASLRICPGDEREGRDPSNQTNLEFRASDSTASPHLQLGVIMAAGLQGILEDLPPPTVTHEDMSKLSIDDLEKMGVQRLPTSLAAALDNLEDDINTKKLFPEELLDLYIRHKRHEVELMAELSDQKICERYAASF